MKKIHPKKQNRLIVPKHRLFRRLVKQMIISLLKYQGPENQGEITRRLKSLEHKVGMIERVMSRQLKRNG